jgi:PIN domain nuclease of toxin-antitoxin system
VEHSFLAGSFTMNHKDPFDRLIAAQARIEKIPLLSNDAAFDQFPIERIW